MMLIVDFHLIPLETLSTKWTFMLRLTGGTFVMSVNDFMSFLADIAIKWRHHAYILSLLQNISTSSLINGIPGGKCLLLAGYCHSQLTFVKLNIQQNQKNNCSQLLGKTKKSHRIRIALAKEPPAASPKYDLKQPALENFHSKTFSTWNAVDDVKIRHIIQYCLEHLNL